MVLLEHLVKYGSDRVVSDVQSKLFRVRTLTDFTYYADGSDKGAGSMYAHPWVCLFCIFPNAGRGAAR
ncbi:MAG: hypothetical protein EOO65_01910 [Methanosarcinales archaeon]|nr:MAG: hypothetical protein EOO65_01910 [Methanosarcinales archaeon]